MTKTQKFLLGLLEIVDRYLAFAFFAYGMHLMGWKGDGVMWLTLGGSMVAIRLYGDVIETKKMVEEMKRERLGR